ASPLRSLRAPMAGWPAAPANNPARWASRARFWMRAIDPVGSPTGLTASGMSIGASRVLPLQHQRRGHHRTTRPVWAILRPHDQLRGTAWHDREREPPLFVGEHSER